MKNIPVYLFVGFLESGKTRFIQETLQDKRFNAGERTLLLVCEEGEEEYDATRFSGKNVTLRVIDKPEDLTPAHLQQLASGCRAERVMVEYNGMWSLDDLYNAMPEGWVVYQEMMFAEAGSFVNYNTNMRQLMVDKLKSCELLVLNRATDAVDRDAIHKIVRGVSRRTDIAYEFVDGHVEYDDIEDPLPFDVEAEHIVIENSDYALWYRDMMEELQKYDGKTVTFTGIAAVEKKWKPGLFALGRHVMNCCEADIQYFSVLCVTEGDVPAQGDWCRITAKIAVQYHPLYKREGPVLTVLSLSPAEAPDPTVATFY